MATETNNQIGNETWIPIPEFEGLYEINKLGVIKSIDNYHSLPYGGIRFKKGQVLTPRIHKGYGRITLSNKPKKKQVYIHRLVATVFIPNPDNKPCVNHIDGIKLNNRVDNLEWCTHRENNIHAFINGLKIPYKKAVIKKSLDGVFIKEYSPMSDALKDGYKGSNIRMCLSKKNKTAYGFLWEYKKLTV